MAPNRFSHAPSWHLRRIGLAHILQKIFMDSTGSCLIACNTGCWKHIDLVLIFEGHTTVVVGLECWRVIFGVKTDTALLVWCWVLGVLCFARPGFNFIRSTCGKCCQSRFPPSRWFLSTASWLPKLPHLLLPKKLYHLQVPQKWDHFLEVEHYPLKICRAPKKERIVFQPSFSYGLSCTSGVPDALRNSE